MCTHKSKHFLTQSIDYAAEAYQRTANGLLSYANLDAPAIPQAHS